MPVLVELTREVGELDRFSEFGVELDVGLGAEALHLVELKDTQLSPFLACIHAGFDWFRVKEADKFRVELGPESSFLDLEVGGLDIPIVKLLLEELTLKVGSKSRILFPVVAQVVDHSVEYLEVAIHKVRPVLVLLQIMLA